MEQAVMSIDGQTFGKTYIPDEFTEKFAKLIVDECINICNTTTDHGYLNGAVAGNKIKQHFGVEE